MTDTISILAHAGHGETGFIAGFMHPITGLDHLFAAIAVGLLAFQIGRSATWLLPVVFVTGTLLGGGLARAGVALPGVELGIVASLLAIGVAVALKQAGPLWACGSAIGILAIFHGHAHLAEYEATTGLAGYVAGLVLATGALHAAGVGLAAVLSSATLDAEQVGAAKKLELVRVVGGLVAAFGVAKLTGLV